MTGLSVAQYNVKAARTTITGHCRRLEVSGSANHVAVDSADTISVLGDENAVTYHASSPTINKTGNHNVVTQRPSTR